MTGLAPRAILELVDSYFEAERQLDAAKVQEHFHDDAVLVLPDGRRCAGHAAIGEFYARVYARLAELDVRLVSAATAGDSATVEWEASVLDRAGTMQTLRGVNLIRARAGRFVELRMYFGPAGGEESA